MKSLFDEKFEKFNAILMFGPPGAGKGTVSSSLAHISGHYHLSTGDIFRGLDPNSKISEKCRSFLDKGFLVPDDITVDIWYRYVLGLIATNKFFPDKHLLILDGIPRNIKQACIIENYVNIKKVILLDMPNIDKLIDRLLKRAVIEKRVDDSNKNILKERMQIYRDETEKLLKHFSNDLILKINADQKKLDVFKDVLIGTSDLLS